jgi:hypothetical protein
MKIGIVTFHYALNQGAILQAYALQTLLQSWGHQVEFIDYHPKHYFHYKDFITKSPKLLLEKWRNQYNGIIYRKHQRQFSKILCIGNIRYKTEKDLRNNPPNYDIYIAGSDQIWNFTKKIEYAYMLDFVPHNKTKIAYAASLGQCTVHQKLYNEICYLLSSFRAISIRESNGKDFICKLMQKKEIKVPITQTLDPTLLIKREEYEHITESIDECSPYIASYILSMMEKGHKDIISYIITKKGLKLINLRNPDTCVFLSFAKNRIVTPYQFLSYIKQAEFIICSSFHAVVFSLIFHKPFIVLIPSKFKDKGGNKRISSLLTLLNLMQRCVYDFNPIIIDQLMKEQICWENVDQIISGLAKESQNFLKTYIHE